MVAERPAQAMYGDIRVMAAGERTGPTAPVSPPQADPTNVWDPAENVMATWESVTAMSKLYHPAAGRAGAVPERSLSLSASVDVIDVNGLLGFDSTARGILVLDEKPDVVYSKAVPERYCHFYWPLRYTKKMSAGQWVSELQPYHLTVDIPIDPNQPYPVLLSRVEWSMYALVNTEAKTVDVPFSPTTDWLTLTPGLEIKVEQAAAESGKYQYRIATRYSRSKVLWAPSGAAIALWTHEPTPEVIVTKLDILDPQGKSIRDEAGSGSFGGGSGTGSAGGSGGAGAGGSGDLMTGTVSGMGSCSLCGTATTFRFTLALKPQQQQLRFILENVPVPVLSY
jgi:uncharacterized membrane protein YgcG